MKRGQIWWVELPEPTASEPGYRRPVIVVQSDAFNRSRINTVVAVAVTSNLKLAEAPGNVRLSARQSGLKKESVANVSQIITLDKRFLAEMVSQLDPKTMSRIDDGMRLALAL